MSGTIIPAADDRQRLSPRELFQRLNLGMHEQARREGVTFSQFLDRELPAERDGLDGFQRMLREAGILTRTHPRGYYRASTVEAFARNEQARALFPEWVARTLDKVRFRERTAPVAERAVVLSDDAAVGTILRPYGDDPVLRLSDATGPAIPIEEVVSRTRFEDSDRARSFYLNRDDTATRRKRVAEAADIPRARITTKQHEIPLYKYGIAMEASYETMRRLELDEFAAFLQREAISAEVDKVAAILDVIVNGDGNTGTAATSYNLTALDGAAVAGTLTLKGWLAFKAKFANPYMLTSVLAQEAVVLQLLLLNMGSGNVLLQERPDLGGFVPMNQTFADGVRWGITTEAPTLKIVGFDRRYAIGRIVETGSLIQEVDRWITRQVNVLTVSENEGYEVLDPKAVKILNVNA